MPWQEITAVDLRTEFIELNRCGTLSFSELCRRYGISRKTGYKWLHRYAEQGVAGLDDRSRRPVQQPTRTSADVEELIVACRDEYPAWGARKIRRVLADQGHLDLPAPSTITAILRRHGLLNAQPEAGAYIRFEHANPNDLWQMDFKGHVPVGRQRCHPLTVLDDCSRFSLCLHACGGEQTRMVQEALAGTFRRYGLPLRMTMDNGPPWGAGGGNGRFSRLTVWLIERALPSAIHAPIIRKPKVRMSDSIEPSRPSCWGADNSRRWHTVSKHSIVGADNTMRCVRMRLCSCRRQHHATNPVTGPGGSICQRTNTAHSMRCARSLGTNASHSTVT